MRNSLKPLALIFAILLFGISHAQPLPPYGNNGDIGKYAAINGAKIYYEEYGKGEPLLLIHGNKGSIKDLEYQIQYFKSKYRVIVADSRGHGKSELKTDSITFTQITKDWEGLVNHLNLDSIHILGWSDGGIVGLMMAINGRVKIRKIVAMGANLRPDTMAVNTWALDGVKQRLLEARKKMARGDSSRDWNAYIQLSEMLLYQPDISNSDLRTINVPVLVMAGDRDVIKNAHSVEIFENLKNGQLCIMPGVTHGAPRINSQFFNEIVNRFLSGLAM